MAQVTWQRWCFCEWVLLGWVGDVRIHPTSPAETNKLSIVDQTRSGQINNDDDGDDFYSAGVRLSHGALLYYQS